MERYDVCVVHSDDIRIAIVCRTKPSFEVPREGNHKGMMSVLSIAIACRTKPRFEVQRQGSLKVEVDCACRDVG